MTIIDQIKHINKNSSFCSKFLSPQEQAQVINYNKSFSSYLIGGYEGAEYKRLALNSDCSIVCYQISYNEKFLQLSHQNILGSLMGLQIERHSIGDILVKEAVFFVIEELSPFIEREFVAIGNSPIDLKRIDPKSLKREITLQEETMIIDSMRLDLIVSRIGKTSRQTASMWIKEEWVKVNHLPIYKATKTIKDGDIISIRKQGRFLVLDSHKRSKKNKIILKYGKFV
jgi:RNA-binding protein YlmH